MIRNVNEFCPKFPLKSLSVQNHYRFHLLQGMVPGLDVPQLVELLRIHRGGFSIDIEAALLFLTFLYLLLFGTVLDFNKMIKDSRQFFFSLAFLFER